MNCQAAREEITYLLVQDVQPSVQLQQHIETCEVCRKQWQQQALEQWITKTVNAPITAAA
jgi:predicted anti-sigma-YlaC factor YlaD